MLNKIVALNKGTNPNLSVYTGEKRVVAFSWDDDDGVCIKANDFRPLSTLIKTYNAFVVQISSLPKDLEKEITFTDPTGQLLAFIKRHISEIYFSSCLQVKFNTGEIEDVGGVTFQYDPYKVYLKVYPADVVAFSFLDDISHEAVHAAVFQLINDDIVNLNLLQHERIAEILALALLSVRKDSSPFIEHNIYEGIENIKERIQLYNRLLGYPDNYSPNTTDEHILVKTLPKIYSDFVNSCGK